MVNFFEFFAIVSEIPSPKHHEIQEFAKNCHISAMKTNEMFVFLIPAQPCSTKILSLINLCDITIIHLEQGCAVCEIWEFHSRNMVIWIKFMDFVIFGTTDLGHNGKKFKKIYHLNKPSYMPYRPCRK
jgi:hypothetical protein